MPPARETPAIAGLDARDRSIRAAWSALALVGRDPHIDLALSLSAGLGHEGAAVVLNAFPMLPASSWPALIALANALSSGGPSS